MKENTSGSESRLSRPIRSGVSRDEHGIFTITATRLFLFVQVTASRVSCWQRTTALFVGIVKQHQ